MEFYQKEAATVVGELNSNIDTGLSGAEAESRLKKYGKNEFTPAKKESIWHKVYENLTEKLIMLLLAGGIISLALGEYIDGAAIFGAVFLCTCISIGTEGQADKAFEKLNQQNNDIRVKVMRNGTVGYVQKSDITIGDIIYLETGDKAPADCRVISATKFRVDESMLTGEPEPIGKISETIINPAQLADRKNMVYGGTFVVEGHATAIVTTIGDNTEMGKIAKELSEVLNTQTPLQEKLGELGGQISVAGTILSSLVFLLEIYKMYSTNTLSVEGVKTSFIVSVALIVAAVPEGLPTMVAATLALNTKKMAKENALVRKIDACETVGSINIICSDKTGTLTQNKMTVTDVYYGGEKINVDSVTAEEMLHNFCLNSTANIDENGSFVGNPTEAALLVCATKNGIDHNHIRKNANIVNVNEFSSARKMMSTAVKSGDGCRLHVKGAPERILDVCTRAIDGGRIVDFTPALRAKADDQIRYLQGQAKRILLFAFKDIDIDPNWDDNHEIDLVFAGFVGIEDPLRPEVKPAVHKCHNAGINVKMLTGDHITTARAIATQLDMIKADSIVIEAKDIEKMSDEELKSKLPNIVVIARCTPTIKLRVVKLLKEMGNSVAVTGDGINDAPALKSADVGIAMGIAGTEVSKEAAKIVLGDDSFGTIVKGIKWGRGIYENFQRFIRFQLTVNVVAFGAAFLAEICAFKLPFNTLQLLWVNIIMDGPPALSLGLEPPRDHLLEKEPIPRNQSIVTKNMLFGILTNGFFMIAALMYVMYTQCLGGTEAQQETIIFTTFAMFQIFNSFNCRELDNTSIFVNLFKNKMMLIIISLTFLIQVAVTQLGGKVFHTVPLDSHIWMMIIGYSLSIIVFNETIKLVRSVVMPSKHKVTSPEA